MFAVGVEPADDTAVLVHRGRTAAAGQQPLRAGAACVVLERANRAAGVVVGDVYTAAPSGDPADPTGDMYGAAGVVRLARAATLLARGLVPGPVTVSCGDEVDGWRAARVSLMGVTGAD